MSKAVIYSGVADALDNLSTGLYRSLTLRNQEENLRSINALRGQQMENLRTANQAAAFELEGKRRERQQQEESSELIAALNNDDLSNLRPELADKVNKQMESQGITPEMIMRRTTAAKAMTPVVARLAAQSGQWRQQAAGGNGAPDFVSLAGTDAQGFNDIKPYLADLFFGKDRFNDKDGAPKLHKYAIGGRTVYGVVDQANPVRDVLFHASSGKVSVPLNVRAVATDDKGKPLKDASGGYVYDDAVQIPGGIATRERGTGPDEAISTMTLPELQQKTQELAKSGEQALQIRRRAMEAEILKRSPAAREGFSKALAGRMLNESAWRSAEGSDSMKQLIADPVLGGAMGNLMTVTRAFGGSPHEALTKAQIIADKASELAQDRAEGAAFIQTFAGLMEAAGKNPENPYQGMVSFFKDNPALIGKKGAIEAVKQAQAAIASDRKDRHERERERIGWGRVEALATRSAAGTEAKAASQEKRDIATRLREAQRSHATAVKTGDPDQIAGAVDQIEALNQYAQEVGVKPLPVPARPMTSEEEAALKTQAIENLKGKRGFVGRMFNSSPSPAAVKAEMERLKKLTPKPRSAAPALSASAPSVSDTLSATAPQPASNAAQPGKAFLSGSSVVLDGKSYPMNQDGTVTIGGRKYRVQ